MERKGITEEIARRIMEIQSEFENENYDILSVENNGDFEELKDKLDLFFKNILFSSIHFSVITNRKSSYILASLIY